METFLRAIDTSDFESRLWELEEDQAASRENTATLRHDWAARFDCPFTETSRWRVLPGLPGRAEGGDFAGLAQHLVDFARVKLLGIDYLVDVFLDDDRPPFSAFQQLAITPQVAVFAPVPVC
jgi:hypothetical protein